VSLLIVDTIFSVYSYIYKLQLVTVSLTQSLIAIHYRIDTLSDTLNSQDSTHTIIQEFEER